MADVIVTAAEVLPASDTVQELGTLGATVTAGQTVYFDSTTSTYKLADANASSATATVKGIALTGGSSGQKVVVATGGSLDPGFTVGVGSVYVQSATAGGIAPVADLATGHRTSIIGVGLSASSLHLVLYNSDTAVP